jgi:hypothetical protein
MAAIELLKTTLFNKASLLGYWRGESNLLDSKGSNNGTGVNITYAAAQFGNGMSFAGNSYVHIGNAINLTGSFTIMMTVKATSIAAQQSIIANDNNTGTRQFNYGINNGGKPYLENAGTVKIGNVGTAITQGALVEMALTFDGTNIRSYIAGTEDYATTMSAFPSSTNEIYFGERQYTGAENPFTGLMDEIAIFSSCLTATELLNHHNGLDGLGGASFLFNFV